MTVGLNFPRRRCWHCVFFRAASAPSLPSPQPWPGPPSPGLEDCGLATREWLEASLPSSLWRGQEMGAARAAPRLRLASLLWHCPTASVFRKEKPSLSASRLRRKEFPLPFCGAERGRVSGDLSKLGDLFFFHFAPAPLSAHKCKNSSYHPEPTCPQLNMLISFSFQHYTGEAEASRRGLGGVDRLLQSQEVLHCIDFKFCFLCFVVFFFF